METNGCTNAIDVAMNGTAKIRNLTPVQTENVAVNIGTNPVSDPKLKNPKEYHDQTFVCILVHLLDHLQQFVVSLISFCNGYILGSAIQADLHQTPCHNHGKHGIFFLTFRPHHNQIIQSFAVPSSPTTQFFLPFIKQ